LAPPDVWIFGHIKIPPAGRVFNGVHKLLEAIVVFLNKIQRSELQLGFHHWIEQVKWVLTNNGDWHHEKTSYHEFVQ
jgi:hypothetical protein